MGDDVTTRLTVPSGIRRVMVAAAGDYFSLQSRNEGDSVAWDVVRSPAAPIDVNARVYVSLARLPVPDGADHERRGIEEFTSWLAAVASKAPQGEPVQIAFEKEGDFEDGYDVFMDIGYFRDPTDEERAAREQQNERAREQYEESLRMQEAMDREEYERLKARFENAEAQHP